MSTANDLLEKLRRIDNNSLKAISLLAQLQPLLEELRDTIRSEQPATNPHMQSMGVNVERLEPLWRDMRETLEFINLDNQDYTNVV